MEGEKSVTDRWFEVLDDLVATGRTSRSRVCRDLGVDRRNLHQQAADHSRRILRVEWLTYLVKEYGVSADWLLTGRGWPFGA